MKKCIITQCMFCDHSRFQEVFEYKQPPIGETDFGLLKSDLYYRKIISCMICGHFYSTGHMDLSTLYSSEYNTSTYKNADGMYNALQRIIHLDPEKSDNIGRCNRIEEFLRHRNVAKQRDSYKILDVGSGLGIFPYVMSKRGYQVTALDPDPQAVRHIEDYVNVPTLCGNFFEVTPLEDYDLIVFNKVLEHVENPIAMLHRAVSFLKKDGLFYVELPDGETAKNIGAEREEFSIDHLHVFSFVSISLLAARVGLSALEIERLQEPSTKFTLRAFFGNSSDIK
ncbi:MAG TPA: class I SAM-dependent methyltransferase [Gammaproteobacteria bacterium]|nr:class I SAM-dependent methyltransferase [Gammaproteobacteria bacterium]